MNTKVFVSPEGGYDIYISDKVIAHCLSWEGVKAIERLYGN